MRPNRRQFVLSAAMACGAVALRAQATPKLNFSGTWKKDPDRSATIRPGTVTLHIDHHDPDLRVEMTIARPNDPEQHADQHYTTDGKESVSTGTDGDSFHTRVTWQGRDLAFTIEEHEEGRILSSTELWSLSPDGNILTRLRRGAKGEQTITYLRQS